jgi:PAS domain S-box-containing protein
MTDLGMAAKLQAVFELSPTIMAVTDLSDGRIVEVNEAFLRALGYAREEIIGRPISDIRLWMDPDLREKGLNALRAGQPVRDMEARFRTKSGAEIVAIANADLLDVDGRTCVVTALMDITERKQLEAQADARREEAETLARAKDEFLAMLGHELRNPLGAITNALVVLNGLVTGDRAGRAIDIIDRQTAHLSRLVDDLLDVARVTSGKIELRSEALDLRALAERSLDTLADAARTGNHQMEIHGETVWGSRRSRPPGAGDQESPRQCAQVHSGGRPRPPHRGARGRRRRPAGGRHRRGHSG